MAFSPVPKTTKGQLNRAGETLRAGVDAPGAEAALDLAEKWRACHAYPINTFQKTLRDKVKALGVKGNPIVAQRLKRMPTIIDKLRRYPKMEFSRMQDIGGVRAVVEKITDVRKLENAYKVKSSNSRFDHRLVGEKDYIETPRSEDGYRSMHLIYEYKNRLAPEYEGLLIEMQLRTKLQHTWATAVETMGIYLNQPLKSRIGDQEWIDFFALASSAFAHMEKLPVVPRYSHLNEEQTRSELAEAEKALSVLEKLESFVLAANSITQNKRPGFYHLITLNTQEKSVRVDSFAKHRFDDAKNAYSKVEARAAAGEKLEPVLVAVGSLGSLQRAYPNFFLDTSEFVRIVREITHNN